MEKTNQISETQELESSYFELQAALGITNHMGGLKATRELANLCGISKETYVLDVGCGIGAAACYISGMYGCRVVGVDIREEMVVQSRKRAEKSGVKHKTEFRVADAQDLPFENDLFDTVISESVIAFVNDKKKALHECVRVVKPQGYVGINEATWIRNPPEELVGFFSRITGVRPELPEKWKELLGESGLRNIVANPLEITYLDQFANEIKMVGLTELFKPWGRLLSLYFKDPQYRKVMKEMMKEALNIPRNVFEYFGYGLYVGTK